MCGFLGYRRNDIRRMLISTLVFLCLLLDRSVTQAQVDPVNEIIQRVNALRAAYGVPAYQVDSALMSAAQAQASWGLENKHFGHDGPGGSTPDDRAKAAGYGEGENSFSQILKSCAAEAKKRSHESAVTLDGVTIPVMANIGSRHDAETALENGADGVGPPRKRKFRR